VTSSNTSAIFALNAAARADLNFINRSFNLCLIRKEHPHYQYRRFASQSLVSSQKYMKKEYFAQRHEDATRRRTEDGRVIRRLHR
jgi:hypothetical protein